MRFLKSRVAAKLRTICTFQHATKTTAVNPHTVAAIAGALARRNKPLEPTASAKQNQAVRRPITDRFED